VTVEGSTASWKQGIVGEMAFSFSCSSLKEAAEAAAAAAA
jgi:hypothetical protein